MIRIIDKKKITLILIGLTGFLTNVSHINAQIVINEVSPASDPEWVELYNISSDSASLKNYSLNFGSDTQNKYFCDIETINGNAYKIISLSTHWLADSGDTVTLKNGDDSVDTISYGSGHALKSPTSTGSISRSPDGGSNWIVLTSSTQQGDVVSFDCPTATPTSTPTPIPTPTNTPTSTPNPTKTPAPTPTRTPIPTPTKTPLPTPTDSPISLVLGDATISESPTPTDSPLVTSGTKNKFPLWAVGLVVLGLGFVGLAIYSIMHINNVKKESSQIS